LKTQKKVLLLKRGKMVKIKLRGWNKKNKKIVFFGKKIANDLIINDDIILMLFTGLKDKNNKEIYEGDIITNGKLKGDIKFGKYKHYFGNSSSPAIGFYLDGDENFYLSEILRRGDFSKIKIIGNIYKNPNLLKNT